VRVLYHPKSAPRGEAAINTRRKNNRLLHLNQAENRLTPLVIRGHCLVPPLPAALSQASDGDTGLSPEASISFDNQILREILRDAVDGGSATPAEGARDASNVEGRLRHTFLAWLPAGVAQLKITGFCQEWGAEVAQVEPGMLVLRVPMPCGRWEWWLGWEPVLSVRVNLTPSQAPGRGLTGVTVKVWPSGCGHRRGAHLLGEVGPLIIDDLRRYLLGKEERSRERLPYDRLVQAFPALPSLRPDEAVACQGRDISASGMCFWSPHEPAASHLGVSLTSPSGSKAISVLARVVWSRPVEGGGCDVGVIFLSADVSLPMSRSAWHQ
jgi:hypothetical protein